MSESRTKLTQILELLLAEDNTKAEEMLHEYVVAKARAEYERVLEAEDEDFGGEEVDQSNDFEADITSDEDEITADEEGDEENEQGEEGEDAIGDEGADLEDKVEDLEAELEALRAEFEALMADEQGEAEHADMDFASDAEVGDEMGDDLGDDMGTNLEDSYDYDLDEDIVEEATNFSNKVGAPKAGQDDNPKGFTAPKKHFSMSGQAVPRIKDGSQGSQGKVAAKNNTPTDNLGIKPKKV